MSLSTGVALLAWVALLLPWQQCRAECHEKLEVAIALHECHTACGDEDAAPVHDCSSCTDSEHLFHSRDSHGPATHNASTFLAVVPRPGETPAAPSVAPDLTELLQPPRNVGDSALRECVAPTGAPRIYLRTLSILL